MAGDHRPRPALLSAFGLVLVMWLVARILRSLVARVLGMSRLDAATEKTQIGKLLRALDPGMTLSRAIATLVYLGVLLMAFMSAADLLGLTTVREAVGSVLSYVPRLITVIFVFRLSQTHRQHGPPRGGGHAPGNAQSICGVARDAHRGRAAGDHGRDHSEPAGGRCQLPDRQSVDDHRRGAGVDRVPLLMVDAPTTEEIIANYYLRRMVAPGDRINLGEIEGTIENFTPIGVMLRDAAGNERFVPARHILDGLACSGRARRSRGRARGSANLGAISARGPHVADLRLRAATRARGELWRPGDGGRGARARRRRADRGVPRWQPGRLRQARSRRAGSRSSDSCWA